MVEQSHCPWEDPGGEILVRREKPSQRQRGRCRVRSQLAHQFQRRLPCSDLGYLVNFFDLGEAIEPPYWPRGFHQWPRQLACFHVVSSCIFLYCIWSLVGGKRDIAARSARDNSCTGHGPQYQV